MVLEKTRKYNIYHIVIQSFCHLSVKWTGHDNHIDATGLRLWTETTLDRRCLLPCQMQDAVAAEVTV